MYRLKEIASSSMSGLPRVGNLSATEKTTILEITHSMFFDEIWGIRVRPLRKINSL